MGRHLCSPGRHLPTRIPEGRPVNAAIVFLLHGHGRLNTSLGPSTIVFFFYPRFQLAALSGRKPKPERMWAAARSVGHMWSTQLGEKWYTRRASRRELQSGIERGSIRPRWPAAAELVSPRALFTALAKGACLRPWARISDATDRSAASPSSSATQAYEADKDLPGFQFYVGGFSCLSFCSGANYHTPEMCLYTE